MRGGLVKENVMEGQLNGIGEMVPGHKVLEGTDLEIAYNLQGDDLVLRVNKVGVLVFRAKLCDAAAEMLEARLIAFNSIAPDLMFKVGDTEEGLDRIAAGGGYRGQ
jgi:hypothetical protein